MATLDNVTSQVRVSSASKAREFPADSLRFDVLMVVLSYWFLIGMYLDGWAHNHGQTDSSFFTPWHAVLYTGAMAVGTVLGLTQIRNMAKGHGLLRALPAGYFPALCGTGIFALGGVFDLVWHTLFGIEANMEALLSPTHLLLASGAFLFLSAPLVAAWRRGGAANWQTLLPAILSMAAVFSQLTFFSQYANFAARPQTLIGVSTGSDNFYFNVYGLMSVVIPSILGISIILLALRRWTLPTGSVTLIWTINTALMIWLRFRFVANVLPALMVIPVGGVLADFLVWRFKPSAAHPAALRWFAFSVPFATSLVYLLALDAAGGGLWWQIHMWLGAPFVAGVTGLFLSYLTVPLAVPTSNPQPSLSDNPEATGQR